MVMLFLLLYLLWTTRDTSAEASDRGNYTAFEFDEFFEDKNCFDEPSVRDSGAKANIHEMNLKLSLEREKLALEKRRFQRESDVKKLRFENDIEKLNL